jgi:uncharacterized protein (DUF2147 family)
MLAATFAVGLLAPSLAAAANPAPATASDPLGDWLDTDGGVIRIERCGTKLCGRIVGLQEIELGQAAPKDVHGRSLCQILIMNDLVEDEPGLWRGHITDPSTGRRWGADVSRDADDRLHLQGYVDLPVLNLVKPTRLWTRYRGHLGDDCRETP